MGQPSVKDFQMVAGTSTNVCSLLVDSVPNLQPSTNYKISFTTEVIDPVGWFTISSPTRLTVPPGVSRAKFSATCGVNLQLSPVQVGMFIAFRLLKNGAITSFVGPGVGVDLSVGIVEDENPILFTPWIPVAPGDYFELQFYYEKTITLSGVELVNTRFDVEFTEDTNLSLDRGYLWAWGNNTYGQLGTGNTTNYSSPVRVGSLNDWVDIRSDDGTVTDGKAAAIRDNGTIWAWGENSNGNIGDGTTTNRSSPTQIGTGTNWAFITENDQSAYAIKTDGTLWSWGRNGFGQLGVGDIISRSSPVQIGALNNWAFVDSYDQRAFGIKTDGSLWAWGANNGLLGLGNTTNYSSPVRVGALNDWAIIACGVYHNLALKTDGSLWVWGSGTSGTLGLGNTTSYSSPVRVGALNDWAMVAGGINYTLAVKTDGSLWGWGLNTGGQLGLGDVVSRSSPARIGALNDWKFVDAGDTASAAIKTDGSLWAWADNSYGALGLGNTVNRSSPTRVGSDNDWITVNTSRSMTLGIKAS